MGNSEEAQLIAWTPESHATLKRWQEAGKGSASSRGRLVLRPHEELHAATCKPRCPRELQLPAMPRPGRVRTQGGGCRSQNLLRVLQSSSMFFESDGRYDLRAINSDLTRAAKACTHREIKNSYQLAVKLMKKLFLMINQMVNALSGKEANECSFGSLIDLKV